MLPSIVRKGSRKYPYAYSGGTKQKTYHEKVVHPAYAG